MVFERVFCTTLHIGVVEHPASPSCNFGFPSSLDFRQCLSLLLAFASPAWGNVAASCVQVSAGNHEVEPNNLTGRIMDPYKARYAMPQVAPTVDTTQYFQVGLCGCEPNGLWPLAELVCC